MYNLDYIHNLSKRYEGSAVDPSVSPGETMKNEWYFQVGRSAVENILVALSCSTVQRVSKVLDIPCGHGRVLRHLVRLFPEAETHACDLDQEGVEFCARAFGAIPMRSKEELTEVDLGGPYDLIWVGSLFTHTCRETTRRWLAHLARFLTPQGIVVATFHGRWCASAHKVARYIAQDRWQEILQEYSAHGFGYRDYAKAESHSFISGSYGVSLAKPHAIVHDLENIPNVRIYLYLERGWADHHDVVAFGRPGYDKQWAGVAQ